MYVARRFVPPSLPKKRDGGAFVRLVRDSCGQAAMEDEVRIGADTLYIRHKNMKIESQKASIQHGQHAAAVWGLPRAWLFILGHPCFSQQ